MSTYTQILYQIVFRTKNQQKFIITHIHPTIAPAYLIKDIKLATSEMMKFKRNDFRQFSSWQAGYGLFTYHISVKRNLIDYVMHQKEHHSKISFLEEYQILLQEHLIEYKNEYLVD